MDVDQPIVNFTVWLQPKSGEEQFHYLSLPLSTSIAALKEKIEEQSSVTVANQRISLRDRSMTEDMRTLADYGLVEDDVVVCKEEDVSPMTSSSESSAVSSAVTTTTTTSTSSTATVPRPPATTSTAPTAASDFLRGTSVELERSYFDAGLPIPAMPSWMAADASTLRSFIRSTPDQLTQILHSNPALGEAILSDELSLLSDYLSAARRKWAERVRKEERRRIALMADPLDVRAQAIIEREIEQKQVNDNYEMATEHMPEAFGRVVMLYVPMHIESERVVAFVDSGAQATIISERMARRCGIHRLIDRRFAGIAKGVGTAKIVGRVHMAQIKFGAVFLPCSFTVMEDADMEFLFGLDMLRRHQGVIDLQNNELRIRGESVKFLSESEVPKLRRELLADASLTSAGGTERKRAEAAAASALAATRSAPAAVSTTTGIETSSSSSLSAPSATAVSATGSGTAAVSSSGSGEAAAVGLDAATERKVQTLVANMNCTRQQAIRALQMAGGNEEMAASVLFEMTGGFGLGF